ncbi:MAG: thioesterase family protein [Coprothermobacterota bacterium]|nr:thioesterase family protein [Coprothermobacterota bacterium]
MVEQSLREGMMFELETTVDPSNIVGPELPVFSTPSMIRLMEHAALKGVEPYLPEGMITVGTRLDIKHLAASPLGVLVRARAYLLKIDRNHLLFKVEAFDSTEQIGEGSHERSVVERAAFLAKCEAKRIK